MIRIRPVFNVRWLASQVAVLNNVFFLSGARNQSSKQEKAEEVQFMSFEDAEDPEEVAAKEALIEQKRNKSKLFPSDYNRQHGKMPYDQPQFPHHETLSYKRRMYGKFGNASGVDPTILWPSRKELKAMKEFDEALQPYTFPQLLARLKEEKDLEEKKKSEREAQVLKKIKCVKAEILEFKKKVDAKIKKAQELAAKKNKLALEGRKKLGYNAPENSPELRQIIGEIQREEQLKVKAAKKALQKEKKKKKLEMIGQRVESSNKDEEKEEDR